MGEHRDVGGTIDRADALEGLGRPGGDHLLGVGEAAVGGELRARVAHERAPARGPSESRERGRVVDRAEDHQSRRRGGHVNEQRHVAHVAALRALGPHQLVGRDQRGGVELRITEAPGRRAVGAHQQLGRRVPALEDRHERGAPVRLGGRGELREGAQPGIPRRTRRSRRRREARRPRPRNRRCRSAATGRADRAAPPPPLPRQHPRRSRRTPRPRPRRARSRPSWRRVAAGRSA